MASNFIQELLSWIFLILIVVFSIYTVLWNVSRIYNTVKNYLYLKKNWSPENYFKYLIMKYYDVETPGSTGLK